MNKKDDNSLSRMKKYHEHEQEVKRQQELERKLNRQYMKKQLVIVLSVCVVIIGLLYAVLKQSEANEKQAKVNHAQVELKDKSKSKCIKHTKKSSQLSSVSEEYSLSPNQQSQINDNSTNEYSINSSEEVNNSSQSMTFSTTHNQTNSFSKSNAKSTRNNQDNSSDSGLIFDNVNDAVVYGRSHLQGHNNFDVINQTENGVVKYKVVFY